MGFERIIRGPHVCPAPRTRGNLEQGTLWRCDECGQLYELKIAGAFSLGALPGQATWKKRRG